MPAPRRSDFVAEQATVAQDIHKCFVVLNSVQMADSESSLEGFKFSDHAEIAQMFQSQQVFESSAGDTESGLEEMKAQVESHPLFQTAQMEYFALINVFVPESRFEGQVIRDRSESRFEGQVIQDRSESPILLCPELGPEVTMTDENPELTAALDIFIKLTQRRRKKAEEFFVRIQIHCFLLSCQM
jgi:hypothetical protein